MDRPTISIVIAVLDGSETLQRCLDSAFEQTYAGWEIVVVDGGSSDGTQYVLERNTRRIEHWESERDRGVYHAWNKALERVRGDWICFLGADDRLRDSTVLERVAACLGSAGEFDVAYASVNIVEPGGAVRRSIGRPWAEIKHEFPRRMAIPHSATFHRRSLFDRYGTFDEGFIIAGDYELLLRALRDNDALFIPFVAVDMAAGGMSDRRQNWVRVAVESHRARRMHGLTRLPAWLTPEIFRARVRAALARAFGRRAADSVADAYRFLARRAAP